jgi:hypothetical protein
MTQQECDINLVLMGVDNFCVHNSALIHALTYILGPLLMPFLGFFGPKDAFLEIALGKLDQHFMQIRKHL